MNILVTIFGVINMVIWMLPPVRQWGTKFFILFLSYAASDLFGFLFRALGGSGSNHTIYLAASIIAFFSILKSRYSVKYIIGCFLLIILLSYYFSITQNTTVSIFTMLFFHMLTCVVLFRDLSKDFLKNHVLSIFISILLFYEMMSVLKFATLFTGFANNFVYFNTTTAIQIIIGLFFTIFKYDNKRFILQFK